MLEAAKRYHIDKDDRSFIKDNQNTSCGKGKNKPERGKVGNPLGLGPRDRQFESDRSDSK